MQLGHPPVPDLGGRSDVRSLHMSISTLQSADVFLPHLECGRISWQPMQSDHHIEFSLASPFLCNVALRWRHFAKRTRKRVHAHMTMIVSCGKIYAYAAELDMLEGHSFWCQGRCLGRFRQGPDSGFGIATHASELDLAAMIGNLRYAARIRPGQFTGRQTLADLRPWPRARRAY